MKTLTLLTRRFFMVVLLATGFILTAPSASAQVLTTGGANNWILNSPATGPHNGRLLIGRKVSGAWSYVMSINGINGAVTCRSINVQLPAAGWADFVFAPGYQLPKLTEVADYIQTHKHLPNIPSATEVERNGINLGEMDAKLLRKIEELTLYMIEQNQQISQQQQQLRQQNLRLEKLEKENQALKQANLQTSPTTHK